MLSQQPKYNKEEKRKLVAATLQWCNERRTDNGLEALKDLPKGIIGDGKSCPCGRACGYFVGYKAYFAVVDDPRGSSEGFGVYDRKNKLGDVPSDVEKFARAFDERQFPQYEDHTSYEAKS